MPVQKWAYQVSSYSDVDVTTGHDCDYLAANVQGWSKEDGPETPVGLPNLILESAIPPGQRLFDTGSGIVPIEAVPCDSEGHPPHR